MWGDRNEIIVMQELPEIQHPHDLNRIQEFLRRRYGENKTVKRNPIFFLLNTSIYK